MGMAKLNIFVSGRDDPCGVSNRTWYITIYDCDGNVFEWCGKRYVVMRAKCGHLHVEVPPGCYYVKAVWSYWIISPLLYRVNHFTDAAIVVACCDQTTCIKLFNPSVHRCGNIFVRALQDLVRQKVLKREQVKKVEGVIDEALRCVGEPPKKLFELGHQQDFENLAKNRRRPKR